MPRDGNHHPPFRIELNHHLNMGSFVNRPWIIYIYIYILYTNIYIYAFIYKYMDIYIYIYIYVRGTIGPPLFLPPFVLGCCNILIIVVLCKKQAFPMENHGMITRGWMVPATYTYTYRHIYIYSCLYIYTYILSGVIRQHRISCVLLDELLMRLRTRIQRTTYRRSRSRSGITIRSMSTMMMTSRTPPIAERLPRLASAAFALGLRRLRWSPGAHSCWTKLNIKWIRIISSGGPKHKRCWNI